MLHLAKTMNLLDANTMRLARNFRTCRNLFSPEILPRLLPIVVALQFSFLSGTAVEIPSHPVARITEVSSWPGYTRGPALKTKTVGNLVFIAANTGGLVIFDISDPAKPNLLSRLNTPGVANDITIYGHHAYIAAAAAGLLIVNIADPLNPELLEQIDTTGNASGVFVNGSYLYLADADDWTPSPTDGLLIFDLANPSLPMLLGQFQNGQGFRSVVVRNNLAYAAAFNSGFYIIDVTDSANPKELSFLPLERPRSVAVSGNFAYIAKYWGPMEVVDIADPAKPVAVTVSRHFYLYSNFAAVSGNYGVYIGRTPWGSYSEIRGHHVKILDVSLPSAPKVVGSYRLPRPIHSAEFVGNLVLLAEDRGVSILDLADPANPAYIANCETGGFCQELSLQGQHLYMADGAAGLQAIDLSVLAKPERLGNYRGEGAINSLAVQNDHAFVTTEYLLESISLTNPAAPRKLSELSTLGFFQKIALGPTFAVVEVMSNSEGSPGNFAIVDVSDPSQLSYAGGFSQSPVDVVLKGTLAFVTTTSVGFQSWDIADSKAPELLGQINTTGNSGLSLSLNDNYVLTTTWRQGGLQVIDVTDPTSPRLISSYLSDMGSYESAMADNYAYIIGTSLEVLDMHDPASPRKIGSYPVDGNNLIVEGNYIYVAQGADGLKILRIDILEQPSLLIQDLGGQIEISWPASSAFTLETSNSIAQEAWALVSVNPQLVDGVYKTLLPLRPEPAFFRLIHE